MRKASFLSAIASIPLLMTATLASAQQFGTAPEAKAMLEKAVTEVKANPTAAVDKFKNGEAGFEDRDLYVFCFEAATGKAVAHPSLMGADIRALKDKTGAPIGDQNCSLFTPMHTVADHS
jgi:hypothetical protein